MAIYYQRLNPPHGLSTGYIALLDAIDAYTARAATTVVPAERAVLLNKAERVRQLLNRMWREYEQLGVDSALKGDDLIRQFIRQTAVRPSRSGRLEQGIHSRAIQTTWPGAAVGIADIDRLDATVINPRYKRYGPYWRSQEYGLPALTPADYGGGGRKVAPGFFMPGMARPARSQFRVHPYFEQMPYSKGMPALMRLRPVPARHFLEKGADALIVWRRGEMARINRHAVSTLASI